MQGKSLYDYPIHLGSGARAVAEPQFTGFEWYEAYGERHADDLEEGRIVSLFRFEESWTSWSMRLILAVRGIPPTRRSRWWPCLSLRARTRRTGRGEIRPTM
jgi:hypothetical protein